MWRVYIVVIGPLVWLVLCA